MRKTLLTLALIPALCFGGDPQVGTWRAAQLEHWKVSPGTGAEEKKSHMFTIELVGKDAYRSTVTGLDGTTILRAAETDIFDGRIKITDAKTNRRSKHERIDAYHLRETFTSDKGTLVQDIVVSPDGKILTMVRKGNSTNTGAPVDRSIYTEATGQNALARRIESGNACLHSAADADRLLIGNLAHFAHERVQLFVLRIEMRSDAHARAGTVIDQNIAARKLLGHFVTVGDVDDDSSAAHRWILR